MPTVESEQALYIERSPHTEALQENEMKHGIPTIFATLAASALLATGIALAQPPDHEGVWDGAFHEGTWHGGPPSAQGQLARLHELLQLTDEQSQQLLAVLLAREDEQQALRTRILEEMRPEICMLRRNTEADILAVLTPEQAELFLQHQAERPIQAWEHRGQPMPALECEE